MTRILLEITFLPTVWHLRLGEMLFLKVEGSIKAFSHGLDIRSRPRMIRRVFLETFRSSTMIFLEKAYKDRFETRTFWQILIHPDKPASLIHAEPGSRI